MSKFLRTMTALSKKPSDYRRPPVDPVPAPVAQQEAPQSESTTVPVLSTVPDTTTVLKSGAVAGGAATRSHARVRVFRATRVEHGHSIGEHLIYEVLWRNAIGDDQTRTIQIGYDRLGALANVNWKTAKSCLKALGEKLAIEVIGAENSNERTGKTYRVHSFTAILERRRRAGMEWVEKGRGVRFIARTVPLSNTVPVFGTVPSSRTVPETGPVSVLKSGTASVPEFSTPLGNIRNIEEISSSSYVLAVSSATQKYGIVLDDDAARKLVRRCHSVREDVSEDEIAYFTELKINQLKNSRTVENWVGMLIASVPVYFEGRATELHRYRAQKEHDIEQRRKAAQETRQMAQETLDDPQASNEERAWAQKVLADAL